MKRCFQLLATALMTCWASSVADDARPALMTNAPPTLHNVFRLTPRVLSGSQPEGDAVFAWLAAQGVKTIISVDGARPDVEAARRHGLRYVHLPVGYDGVPSNHVASLVQVATTLPGPIYVHCHHGKHRGPAAAAILCEADAGWSATQAEAFLKEAGTSPDYPGLFRSVREFRPPAAAILRHLTNALPEISPTPGVVQVMVIVDGHFERLRAAQKAGWRTPPDHPDVAPPHEATQLWEQFRELGRAPEVQSEPESYRELLRRSEEAADQLRQVLKDPDLAPSTSQVRADAALRQLTELCTACHRQHRN